MGSALLLFMEFIMKKIITGLFMIGGLVVAQAFGVPVVGFANAGVIIGLSTVGVLWIFGGGALGSKALPWVGGCLALSLGLPMVGYWVNPLLRDPRLPLLLAGGLGLLVIVGVVQLAAKVLALPKAKAVPPRYTVRRRGRLVKPVSPPRPLKAPPSRKKSDDDDDLGLW